MVSCHLASSASRDAVGAGRRAAEDSRASISCRWTYEHLGHVVPRRSLGDFPLSQVHAIAMITVDQATTMRVPTTFESVLLAEFNLELPPMSFFKLIGERDDWSFIL